MEEKMASGNGSQGSASKEPLTRRRKKDGEAMGARFFLLKPGCSLTTPQLGQEMNSEGDALIEALKSGQAFLSVTAFRAVAQQNGGYPVITKQLIVDSKAE
jgi:hypothetical protein